MGVVGVMGEAEVFGVYLSGEAFAEGADEVLGSVGGAGFADDDEDLL
jgi:hypothetical protein